MVNYRSSFPAFAWNSLSIGISTFLCCSGISIVRAHNYQIEHKQFKLEVGAAISQVQRVSDTLERTAQTSAIAPKQKREIQQLTQKSSAVLEQVESDIELETEKLIYLEDER